MKITKPEPNSIQRAYTPRDFQDAYGISHTTMYDQAKKGLLILRKVGTKTLILRADAEAWAASLPVAEPAIQP